MPMTADWYHCTLKPISRADGRSAVARAAYCTGLTLDDARYATVRAFPAKREIVGHFTLAPAHAPAWASTAAQLWNAVEAQERRANAQLAFEWEIALPSADLDDAQREALARRFAGWLADTYGVAVTVGLHGGAGRGNHLNEHMHVMMTTRPLTADGWARTKLRDFNCRPGTPNPNLERVRGVAADFINDALEDAGSATRVTHLSLEARGIERAPTTHLGPAANARIRRGEASERGDLHRQAVAERLVWQEAEARAQAARMADYLTGELAGEDRRASAIEDPLPPLPAPMPPIGIEAEHAAMAAAAAPYHRQITRHGAIAQRDGPSWPERAMALAVHWRDAARNLLVNWRRGANLAPDHDQPELH